MSNQPTAGQDGLRGRTLRGLLWSFSERAGQQGVHFVIGVILARMLSPDEFGLVAMLAIFIGLAQAFVDSGFGSALVQKQAATPLDECSIFYFNVLLGLAMAGALCVAAPWIAAFYERPSLVPLTRALSLNLVILAFGVVQTTLITKRIDFQTHLKVSLMATLVSGVVGIGMAYRGFGVWSLVGQSLSMSFMRTLLVWVFSAWRPAWMFSMASLRSMSGYGSRMLVASLFTTVFDNLYALVIGKVFTAGDLGYYSRARSLQELPVRNIAAATTSVTFPVFSSVQQDKPRLQRGVRKALESLALITFPAMVGLAITAQPLVVVLLTEKWLPSVPYLRLLCVVGALYPLHAVNVNVLTSQGRSDLNLRIAVVKNGLKVGLLLVTWRWGIEAILLGQIVGSLLSYAVNCHYTRTLIGYSMWQQLRDVSPYLAIALGMGAGVHAVRFAPLAGSALLLAVQVSAGVALLALACVVFRPAAFVELEGIARKRVARGL